MNAFWIYKNEEDQFLGRVIAAEMGGGKILDIFRAGHTRDNLTMFYNHSIR